MAIRLTVLSPEKQLLSCDVDLVELPGTQGRFVILPGHDAIISSLGRGVIRYKDGGGEHKMEISSGFVRLLDDEVTACVEL